MKLGNVFLITILLATAAAAGYGRPRINSPAVNYSVQGEQCTVATRGGNLNVRSRSGRIIDNLKNGAVVFINERLTDGRASISERRGGKLVVVGWVAQKYLDCGSARPEETGDPNASIGDGPVECSVVTEGGNLNLRTRSGRIIGQLKNGSIVYINERSSDGRASVSERRAGKLVVLGWVSGAYLSCTETPPAEIVDGTDGTGLSESGTEEFVIGNLNGDFSGCSCLAQTLSEAGKTDGKFLFYSDLETSDVSALFNINGLDTTFRLVKKGKRPTRDRPGTRFSDEYEADGIKVVIEYLTVAIQTESADYDMTLTFTKGEFKKTIKAAGSCGC